MSKMAIPKGLEEYYRELETSIRGELLPNCPVCKCEMSFDGFEEVFTRDELIYIRRFKCENCTDKRVILWRKWDRYLKRGKISGGLNEKCI